VNSREYGRIRSDIDIKDAQATLHLTAAAYDAAVRATVRTGLDRNLSGRFDATHRKYGEVRVTGGLSGTLDNPRANSQIIVRGASYENIGPLNANANASLADNVVTVSGIRADLKNSTVTGGVVRINLTNRNISGLIPEINVNLNDFIADVQGRAQFSATIDGSATPDRVRVSLTGSSNGFDVGGTHIDRAELNGQLSGNEFRLARLTARKAEGSLTASGAYNLTTKRVAGDVNVTNLAIVQVRDLFTIANLDAHVTGTVESPDVDFKGSFRDVVYQGQAHGNVTVEGVTRRELMSVQFESDKYTAAGTAEVRMEEPFPFKASVNTKESRLQYEQYDVVANGTVHASGHLQPLKAESVTFENFRLVGEGLNLTATGSLATGARVNATADLSQLPVDGAELIGTARVQAVVAGTIDDPRVDGSLETTNAKLRLTGMPAPADVAAGIEFTRDRFVIEQLHASYAGATADVSGQGTLKGTGEFRFKIDNFRPERVFPERRSSGIVSLEGALSVEQPSSEGISGQARFTQLDLNLRDAPFRQVEPVEIILDKNQMLSVRNFTFVGLDSRASMERFRAIRATTS